MLWADLVKMKIWRNEMMLLLKFIPMRQNTYHGHETLRLLPQCGFHNSCLTRTHTNSCTLITITTDYVLYENVALSAMLKRTTPIKQKSLLSSCTAHHWKNHILIVITQPSTCQLCCHKPTIHRNVHITTHPSSAHQCWYQETLEREGTFPPLRRGRSAEAARFCIHVTYVRALGVFYSVRTMLRKASSANNCDGSAL